MNEFVCLSVGLVIFIGLLIATGLISALMTWGGDGDIDDTPWFAWLLSTAGFTICLYMVLCERGLLS